MKLEKLISKESLFSDISAGIQYPSIDETCRELKGQLSKLIGPSKFRKESDWDSIYITCDGESEYNGSFKICKEEPFYNFTSINLAYAMVKCKVITTCFIENNIFSYFTNPDVVDRNFGLNSLFIFPGFNGFNIEDFFEKLQNSKELIIFVNNLNEYFNDKEITQIRNIFKAKILKRILLSILLLTILVIFFILVFIYDEYINEQLGISNIVIILTILILLTLVLFIIIQLLISAIVKLPQNRDFLILKQRLKNQEQLETFITEWNNRLFKPNQMKVFIPVNFKYIHLLLDPVDIYLEHHDKIY
jgi:hypothetical protein